MIESALANIEFEQWSWLVPWVFAVSGIVFVGSILGVWVMLVRLPPDYISRKRTLENSNRPWNARRIAKKVTCNLVGVGFMCIGIVMLFTPGQGLLSFLAGLTLVDFPGKPKLIRRLLSQPRVFTAVNKLRSKSNKPPLILPTKNNFEHGEN